MFSGKDVAWWYWLAILLLLIAGTAGSNTALRLVLAIAGVQVLHYAAREAHLTAFPVQVRVAYLGLLLLGLWEPLRFIHGIQVVGTSAMVAVGYCPLARLLSLAPWNRREPLTLALIRRTLFSAPVRGSVLRSQPMN